MDANTILHLFQQNQVAVVQALTQHTHDVMAQQQTEFTAHADRMRDENRLARQAQQAHIDALTQAFIQQGGQVQTALTAM